MLASQAQHCLVVRERHVPLIAQLQCGGDGSPDRLAASLVCCVHHAVEIVTERAHSQLQVCVAALCASWVRGVLPSQVQSDESGVDWAGLVCDEGEVVRVPDRRRIECVRQPIGRVRLPRHPLPTDHTRSQHTQHCTHTAGHAGEQRSAHARAGWKVRSTSDDADNSQQWTAVIDASRLRGRHVWSRWSDARRGAVHRTTQV